MKTHKRVLLLGGTGFIGKAILDHLLHSEFYEVKALQHQTSILKTHRNLEVIQGNIGSLQLNALRPDIIIHAARNRTGRFGSLGRWIMSQKGEMENRKLLQQIKKMKHPPHIIYCSGSLMYGSYKDTIIDESFPVRPASFARQYVAAERPFMDEMNKGALPITMLRLPWVVGAGSWFQWNYKHWMAEHKAVPVYGSGENMMTFVDVAIIGDAITELVGINFRGVFNLFHPQHLSQLEWAKIVAGVSGLPIRNIRNDELSKLPLAVQEAFTTDIMLGSQHKDVQQKLLHLHKPLPSIVRQHLYAGQHK